MRHLWTCLAAFGLGWVPLDIVECAETATGEAAEAERPGQAVEVAADGTIAGQWTGTVRQPGFAPYTVIMNIETGSGGSVCGSTSYPEFPCSGTLRCDNSVAGSGRFRETITEGRDKCIDGTIAVKLSGGQLDWQWIDPQSGKSASNAVLRRLLETRNHLAASSGTSKAADDQSMAAEILTGEQIRQLLFGNTAMFSSPPGHRKGQFFEYVRAPGEVVVLAVYDDGESQSFEARGRVVGDQWCFAYTTGDTREACWRIARSGKQYRLVGVDSVQYDLDFTVEPGDARQLARVNPATKGHLLRNFAVVSQTSAKSYRDPTFRELPDTANGQWKNASGKPYRVKDLACLAAVYAMIERGLDHTDTRIDDGLYDDPRGKPQGGQGALAPKDNYIGGEEALDIPAVAEELRNGRPVVLGGSIPNGLDHYVLVVGIGYANNKMSLAVLDPLPMGPGDEDPVGRAVFNISSVSGNAALYPRLPGLVFDRMRRMNDSWAGSVLARSSTTSIVENAAVPQEFDDTGGGRKIMTLSEAWETPPQGQTTAESVSQSGDQGQSGSAGAGKTDIRGIRLGMSEEAMLALRIPGCNKKVDWRLRFGIPGEGSFEDEVPPAYAPFWYECQIKDGEELTVEFTPPPPVADGVVHRGAQGIVRIHERKRTKVCHQFGRVAIRESAVDKGSYRIGRVQAGVEIADRKTALSELRKRLFRHTLLVVDGGSRPCERAVQAGLG